jgi:hypothetical protein
MRARRAKVVVVEAHARLEQVTTGVGQVALQQGLVERPLDGELPGGAHA